jgi:hypothetical protein
MRNLNKLAMIPRDQFSGRTDMIWIPSVGGQAGSKNINGITLGYPTRVSLGASHTGISGQWVYLSGMTGATQMEGQYYRVLYTESAAIYLDVDSTGYATWTSGGTCNFDVWFDRCGNVSPMLIQGTTTSAWANPGDGFTSDSAGNNSLHIPRASLPDMVDFSNAQYAVFGVSARLGAAPSAFEQILALGQRTSSQGSAGFLGFEVQASNTQIGFGSRPATSAAGSNSFSYSSTLGTTALRKIAAVVDFASGYQYVYLDGVLKDSDALSTTNSIGRPTAANGMFIGADYNASLTAANKLGGAATPSQARIKDLFIWRPADGTSASDIHAAVREYHRVGEWPAGI